MALRQRLDKWLWFARVVKSRSLAARLVAEGHVRLNARRIETPGKAVGPGDVLTIALGRLFRSFSLVRGTDPWLGGFDPRRPGLTLVLLYKA